MPRHDPTSKPDIPSATSAGTPTTDSADIQLLKTYVGEALQQLTTGAQASASANAAVILLQLRNALKVNQLDRGPGVPSQELAVQDGPWSDPDSPSRWAKVFKMSRRTFVRHAAAGKIRTKKLSDRSYRVHLDEISARRKSGK